MQARSKSRTEEQSVRRLLRRKATQEYFREDGSWTTDPVGAKPFNDVVEAAEICARLGLSDVELILRTEAGDCDVFSTPMR